MMTGSHRRGGAACVGACVCGEREAAARRAPHLLFHQVHIKQELAFHLTQSLFHRRTGRGALYTQHSTLQILPNVRFLLCCQNL